MTRVYLVHWHLDEAAERCERLAQLGHDVLVEAKSGIGAGPRVKKFGPEVAVIDLDRLPSHGREMATWLRRFSATREVRIVFVGGDDARQQRALRDVPDAQVATWRGIRGAIERALRAPVVPAKPVKSSPTGYSGTPLAKKLGIKAGARVALLGAPQGFAGALAGLPDGVTVGARLARANDVIVLFVANRKQLEQRFATAADALAPGGGLWVAWYKKASGVVTDIGEADVRRHGLDCGLVDNKVCAIDATWSGLRFMRRTKSK